MQKITQEQWDRLSEDQRIYFADWFLDHYSPREYPTVLANLEQLLQFIEEHEPESEKPSHLDTAWQMVVRILNETVAR